MKQTRPPPQFYCFLHPSQMWMREEIETDKRIKVLEIKPLPIKKRESTCQGIADKVLI